VIAREVFANAPEAKKQLWGGELWGKGFFVNTVGQHGSEKVIAEYVAGQGKGFPFIRIGFDTPKLASALIGGKMTDGKLLHPQESQCIGADVSLGLCREISPGGDE